MTVDKHFDLILGNLGNEKPVEPPSPAMGSMFGSLAPSNLLFGSALPVAGTENFGALIRALSAPPPALPVTPAPRPQPVSRMTYFAFDFDDLMRVNNVRQTGKIGLRVMPMSRGFRDRSVWEASKAFTDRGLKEMMQRASKFSSVTCVLIGANTWVSRWVRYEIALAIINERGLLAVDLNSIKHNIRRTPDPLGVNPLSLMGLRKEADGSWHLVERKPVELENGHVGFEWHWYDDYQPPVPKPKFMPDIELGQIVPLSSYTKRYDFTGHSGSMNMSTWLDMAANEAGR
jgi:hypothetical protein